MASASANADACGQLVRALAVRETGHQDRLARARRGRTAGSARPGAPRRCPTSRSSTGPARAPASRAGPARYSRVSASRPEHHLRAWSAAARPPIHSTPLVANTTSHPHLQPAVRVRAQRDQQDHRPGHLRDHVRHGERQPGLAERPGDRHPHHHAAHQRGDHDGLQPALVRVVPARRPRGALPHRPEREQQQQRLAAAGDRRPALPAARLQGQVLEGAGRDPGQREDEDQVEEEFQEGRPPRILGRRAAAAGDPPAAPSSAFPAVRAGPPGSRNTPTVPGDRQPGNRGAGSCSGRGRAGTIDR